MKKERAEELLSETEHRLRDAEKRLEECKEEVAILLCAKAYLEFIISGFVSNPSMKRKKEDE